MRPKPVAFKSEVLFCLDQQINMGHALVRLASLIDWAAIERTFSEPFTSGTPPSGLSAAAYRWIALPVAHIR